MPVYSNVEMANMHFLYGLANGNALKARRFYAERYPERHLASSRMFSKIHLRLQQTGSFAGLHNNAGRPRSIRTADLEEEVLQIIEDTPETSTRKIALQIGCSPKTVWNVLKQNLLYPYHILRVQALLPVDYPQRVQYCLWLSLMIGNNPDFSSKILFTDEANFSRECITNFHNNHIWSDENPNAIVESRFQHKFSLNVWVGIIGDFLIGPHFLPQRLDGNSYLNFIQNELPNLLQDIDLARREGMWFMHDGAPAHFALNVRHFLNDNYQNRWIGRGGPQPWPPRSPDLNPLDFFLWGHLKSLVYTTPVENVDNLRNRIIEACDTIRNTPGIFERVRQCIGRRNESCILAQGGHFQHLL